MDHNNNNNSISAELMGPSIVSELSLGMDMQPPTALKPICFAKFTSKSIIIFRFDYQGIQHFIQEAQNELNLP